MPDQAAKPEVQEVCCRIVAPHFVAGVIATDGRVSRAAPILAYMLGWDGRRVAAYVQRKGWTWAVVPKAEEGG